MHKQESTIIEFTDFVTKNKDLLWHICKDFSFNPVWNTEDAYQEILCSLWTSWDQINDPGKRKEWACRVAYSTLLNIKRKSNNKKKTTIPASHVPSILDIPDTPDDSQLNFSQLINLLPKNQRDVIKAYFDGFSHCEIAAMLNISEAASRQRHSRAIRKLKQLYYEENI